MKTPMTQVSRNTGKNPVAQAVARERLRKALIDQRIALLMLQDGEPCADLLGGVAGTMQVVQLACQVDNITGPEVNVLKGGLNACVQVMLADRYDTLQTTAILQGLDKAQTLVKWCRAESINRAWQGMQA